MIVGVAIKLKDGRVFALPRPARHCNLFEAYNTKAREAGWPFPWKGWPSKLLRRGEQGFISSSCRFLTREEAASHAKACGQYIGEREGLFSEDLW